VTRLLGRTAGNTLGVAPTPPKAAKRRRLRCAMYPEDYIELCRIIGQDAIAVEAFWTLLKHVRTDGSIGPITDRSIKTVGAGFIRKLSAVHWGLPNATVGYASNRATFILAGPGVAEGRRGVQVNLVDVAPTLSYLLGIRRQSNAKGRILWQAYSQ